MKHLELKLDSVKALTKAYEFFKVKSFVVRRERIVTRDLAILNEGQL